MAEHQHLEMQFHTAPSAPRDGAPVTMTSMELVEFINSQRDPGEAVLRHDHFMAKVPKVLWDAAPKFLGTASYANGTGGLITRPCYRFPKREACLMAMSYGYDLEAKAPKALGKEAALNSQGSYTGKDNTARLLVCDVGIRMDADGRYFLNDLHRASGGADKDKPNRFLRLESTAQLIAELCKHEKWASEEIKHLGPIRTVNSFNEEQGTYVVKELVYAYAMWISAVFHLKVIRAYDALVSAPPAQFQIPRTLSDALRLAADLADRVQQQQEALQAARPMIAFHERVAEAENAQSMGEVAKVFRTGRTRLFARLRAAGVLMANNVPYQKHVDAGYFRVVERTYNRPDGSQRLYTKTLVTGKGLQYLHRLMASN